jgi:predicted PurR-regulated permease PerM
MCTVLGFWCKIDKRFCASGIKGARQMKVSNQGRAFFFILLVAVFLATYFLLKPYLGVVVFSVITVVIFKPVFDWILKRVGGHKGWATTLTIITIFLAVLIPALIVVNITVNQAITLVRDISAMVSGDDANFNTVLNKVNEILATAPLMVPYVNIPTYQLSEESILQAVQQIAGPVSNYVATQAVSLGSASVAWITNTIIFLAIVGTLFPTYEHAFQTLKDLSPLPDELDQLYITRFVAMTKAMFKGILVIAVIQGIVAGLLMAATGTWYVFLLTLLAIFVAVLPMGVNVLTVPVAIVHILMGNTWQGIVIIAGSLLLVSNIDNLIRPRLVSRDAYLNPALILLAAFGGLSLFGLLGVIYGPIIVIFFVTTIEIYLKHYRIPEFQPVEQPGEGEKEISSKKGAKIGGKWRNRQGGQA